MAIGRRLVGRPGLVCLGVKPSFSDYTPDEQKLIAAAPVIYYPTRWFASALKALGRTIYPSWESHYFGQDKIRQLTLFNLLDLPMPRTKIYFGRQKERILNDFALPFVAKTPRASALGRGVFLIRGPKDLKAYLKTHNPAYIQEYLPRAIDVRVVVVNDVLLTAYRRLRARREFRANLAQGGRPSFEDVPIEAKDLGLKAAKRCGFDEMGLDVLVYEGRAYVIEANLLFGRQALAEVGIDLKDHLHRLIVAGEVERRLGVGIRGSWRSADTGPRPCP